MPWRDYDVVCDSSSLISLTEACFTELIMKIPEYLQGRLLIPKSVLYECIEHPREIKEYALSAIRLKKALDSGAIHVVEHPEIQRATSKVVDVANRIFFIKGKPMKILHKGEGEMLALSRIIGTKNILMDERTTRILVEDPYSLAEHLEKEFGHKVQINHENLRKFQREFGDINIFRSSELLIVAYEHGFFDDYGDLAREIIEASLYRLKFAGCSISFEEIQKYMLGVR
ncbi:MAG: hypothetical protein QXP42_00085 [Candidatus Micrarchaeia archaeon]